MDHPQQDPRLDGDRLLKRLGVLALLAWPLLSAAANNALTVDYFTISGRTAAELRADLNRLGPVGETGIRGDGYTHWRIAWTFDFAPKGETCVAENFRVTLEVRMILPRWEPPANVAPSLVALWDRYLTALRFHEDGHYSIAIAAADEVRRALVANRTGRHCATLEKQLNSAANDILDQTRRRQANYDRETDSGRRQGTTVL